jgi:hypothetical protein
MSYIRFTVIISTLLASVVGSSAFAQTTPAPRAPAASSTTVTPIAQRQAILEAGRQMLNLAQPEKRLALRDLKNPFTEIVPEVVVVEQPVETKQPEVVEKVRLSDQAILESARPSLRPRGMLVRGDRRVVLLARGPIAEGEYITAVADGETVQLYIENVTTESFVLRLNDTRMLVYFAERTTSGQITRDN